MGREQRDGEDKGNVADGEQLKGEGETGAKWVPETLMHRKVKEGEH